MHKFVGDGCPGKPEEVLQIVRLNANSDWNLKDIFLFVENSRKRVISAVIIGSVAFSPDNIYHRFGKENAAIGNINSRWNEMSAAQQEGIQELLRKYGYSYSPGE